MIVANGPLDGPPVESNAEILELYGDSLSRRDRVQFGSTEDMTGFELADLTGVIGGGPSKPLPIRPDAIISPKNRPPLTGTAPGRPFRLPGVWGILPAYADGGRYGHRHAATLCGKCQPCREWRVFKIMVRYRHGALGKEQHIVTRRRCPNVDEARKWASAQGRRCPGARVTLLVRTEDYLWSSTIIYATPPPNTFGTVRRIPPEEFQTMVPRDACVEGLEGIRRRTCVFTGWPDYEEEPSDHLHDDGYTETGIMQTQREPTPAARVGANAGKAAPRGTGRAECCRLVRGGLLP